MAVAIAPNNARRRRQTPVAEADVDARDRYGEEGERREEHYFLPCPINAEEYLHVLNVDQRPGNELSDEEVEEGEEGNEKEEGKEELGAGIGALHGYGDE